VSPSVVKWPPWISIESPVNPYDPSARGAAMLVRAAFREGQPNSRPERQRNRRGRATSLPRLDTTDDQTCSPRAGRSARGCSIALKSRR
jgi:hypothetical protein